MFDEEVAARVREGDPDAVGEVYVHLADRLLGYLIARVRDRATAEDLVEATFIELLRKGHTITGGAAAIKVWLFRAAYFNALDHMRKVKRRAEEMTNDFAGFDVEEEAEGPDEIAIRRERRRIVRAAMAHLSDDQRAVLEMRYVAELSAPETAAILGKTEGAVRSLQHRGERALGRMLEGSASAPELTLENDFPPGAPDAPF
ncbi:RNA polymerase sigma factor [Euzebya tangerina]|uniref:RNA polymerase sigma factor n=1 Tax=Euzebya tangerina TaxID=591198 RepID=UPI000E3246CB|nr:RNA polymerase sigma factor [Euzebya tangerina]